MNPKSSSVVWGIPQFPKDVMENLLEEMPEKNSDEGGIFAGSMLASGSLNAIMTMVAVVISVSALGVALAHKKKNSSPTTEDEE
jgi:hypothetical protein